MNKKSSAFGGAAIVAIVCGTLGPVIFGEPAVFTDRFGGDAWRNLIFDFQTLFTGALAVVAASFTVWQMQISDGKSDVRHEQAMALALRADKLRLERAVYPQFKELNDCRKEARDIADVITRLSPDVGQYRRPAMHAFVPQAYRLARDIDEIIGRPHFERGSELFPGDLNHRIYLLQSRTYTALPIIKKAYDFLNEDQRQPDDDYYFDVWWDDEGGESSVLEYISFCDFVLPTIIFAMSELAKSYKI